MNLKVPRWRVFKQIFADHWDQFKRNHPRYDRIYYDGLVQKMIDRPCKDARAMLHGGVIYRHTVLTVPAMLRPTFYYNADVLLSAFMRCGVPCMDDFYGQLNGQRLKGGYVVLHTHRRNGQYNPHLRLIATSGGWDPKAERWVHMEPLPYALLNQKWQWHALTMLGVGVWY